MEHLERAFREEGVCVAYLFGSRARDAGRETSDADVAVLADRELGLMDLDFLPTLERMTREYLRRVGERGL